MNEEIISLLSDIEDDAGEALEFYTTGGCESGVKDFLESVIALSSKAISKLNEELGE